MNLVGIHVGRWTVVSFCHKDKHNNHYYKCQCTCGNEKTIAAGNLRNKTSSSCGCLQKKRPFESLYNRFVRANHHRNVSVDMDFNQFLEFTTINECHYCGDPITWKQHNISNYNLDRKDNSKGYSKENCVVCCKICNRMKSSMPYDVFIERCQRIGSTLLQT